MNKTRELPYNMSMQEITGYDIQTDERLYEFLKNAYTKNADVIIPKYLLKDFVQNGCRITICQGVFYKGCN